MREAPYCRCSLCQIETELLTEFLEPDREESCRKILSSAPEFAAFSDLDSLLAHLRLGRDTISSDALLRALVRAKQTSADGTVERMLILVFLPQMHSALRSVLRRYPQLSPKDASQNLLHALLRFLDSGQLESRKDYLGFAIARHVKRAAFDWAEHERRSLVFEPSSTTPELDGSADSFERLAALRHFLSAAVRRGVLNAAELDLLIQFKLENGLDDDTPEFHSNAHRQRLKRLLHKLRLHAVAGGSRNGH
jgi:hypothetical protein